MGKVPRPVIAAVLLGVILGAWLLFGRSSKPDTWLGYVEGESLYIGAPVAGRLASKAVDRGQRVKAGAALFSLDTTTTDADTARLAAQVTAAEAQAANLSDARQRQAELDVSRASAAAASAAVAKAEEDYRRISALAAKGFASRAQLDAARAARDGARADLQQAQAQIRSGELAAGRAEERRAAAADVAGARAALAGQRQVRAEISPASPATGVVEQTYYNPGEWVPANTPIVSVLPDDRRKLRFFVPEERVADLRTGMTVHFSCDGCGGARTATISYIAPRAEFTPPVIYSENVRAKLVFMVEARLPVSDKPLPPGLPVSVKPL